MQEYTNVVPDPSAPMTKIEAALRVQFDARGETRDTTSRTLHEPGSVPKRPTGSCGSPGCVMALSIPVRYKI